MPRDDQDNWDNYWQGRASHTTGNALVEVGIENNHALTAFWTEFFKSQPKTSRIVDLACGAGSALGHAFALSRENLTGIDISQGALDVMRDKVPGAVGVRSALNEIPLPDASFDVAVSQFGIEYAGDRTALHQAFSEMHRLLTPGGVVRVVAHAKGSVIYAGCAASLEAAQMVRNSGFTKIAAGIITELGSSTPSGATTDLQSRLNALGHAAEPILRWLRTTDRQKDQFAQFIYQMLESTHRLINRHAHYSTAESLGWLAGIEAEIAAYEGRMLSMTSAALSRADIDTLMSATSAGDALFTWAAPTTLSFSENNDVAAWVLSATT